MGDVERGTQGNGAHIEPVVAVGSGASGSMTASSERPSVIPRSEIPLSGAPEDAGLEVQPFLAHRKLNLATASTAAELAWIHARPGQNVGLRSHPLPGLLIVLGGRAELFGRSRRGVEQGDVITVPALHEYGFESVGEGGLHALHVMFREQRRTLPVPDASFEHLVMRNEVRMSEALQTPFFALLRDGKLSKGERAISREVLRVFSDAFQTFLFLRQATCRNEEYRGPFLAHLNEELGHNELLSVSRHARVWGDPILKATSSWFCHQMLVLDNAGKAVVNLVLETAGFHFHTLAAPVFSEDVSAHYFNVHAEEDEHHKEVAVDLLRGEHPETYRRLSKVLEHTWDMFDTLTRRFAYLIEFEGRVS
jgi:mannose-6-phosphate isomerase-like protein (cupin superfamily)